RALACASGFTARLRRPPKSYGPGPAKPVQRECPAEGACRETVLARHPPPPRLRRADRARPRRRGPLPRAVRWLVAARAPPPRPPRPRGPPTAGPPPRGRDPARRPRRAAHLRRQRRRPFLRLRLRDGPGPPLPARLPAPPRQRPARRGAGGRRGRAGPAR